MGSFGPGNVRGAARSTKKAAGEYKSGMLSRLDNDARISLISQILTDLASGKPSPWLQELLTQAETKAGAIKSRGVEKQQSLYSTLAQHGGGGVLPTIMGSGIVPQAERQTAGLTTEAIAADPTTKYTQALMSEVMSELGMYKEAWLPLLQAYSQQAGIESDIFRTMITGASNTVSGALGAINRK